MPAQTAHHASECSRQPYPHSKQTSTRRTDKARPHNTYIRCICARQMYNSASQGSGTSGTRHRDHLYARAAPAPHREVSEARGTYRVKSRLKPSSNGAPSAQPTQRARHALTSHGLGHYWKTHYADHTFRNVYRWNAFDISLLIPYFLVMIILAFYGIHRYQLVWLYSATSANQSHSNLPPAHFAEEDLPFVTIQLPIYNEQFVIDRLLDACCRLDYPRDRFEIQLLDDSTDETVGVASAMVARFAAGTQGLDPPAPLLSPPHQPPRLQSRRARRRVCVPPRANSSPSSTPTSSRLPPGFAASSTTSPNPASAWSKPAGRTSIATTAPHPGRSHPPRRPLCPRARRPLPRRRLLQLQRHRRHVASPGHRRSRRLAARHAHRRHRP